MPLDDQNSLDELATTKQQNWYDKVRHSAPGVSALYAPTGLLVPTKSNEIRWNHEGRFAYFEHFTATKPEGTTLERHVIPVGEGMVLVTGRYNFNLDQGGTRGDINAMFSFLFTPEGIALHHSAAVPAHPEKDTAKLPTAILPGLGLICQEIGPLKTNKSLRLQAGTVLTMASGTIETQRTRNEIALDPSTEPFKSWHLTQAHCCAAAPGFFSVAGIASQEGPHDEPFRITAVLRQNADQSLDVIGLHTSLLPERPTRTQEASSKTLETS